jgi:hypothetical protein
MGLYASDFLTVGPREMDVMKKISFWMLALIVVPGMVMLSGCKKAEDTDAGAGEAMAEATPTPMAAEPMMEATPEVTPMAGDNMAPATTPSPAAQ